MTWTTEQIRKTFLDYFEKNGHQIVPSAPMVIKNDPTLMFTNAGMNQFKDIFLGNENAKYKRVADTQKCLRVSGKHNDLEEVGVDTYHHTMFEMLGNWSFDDYFKQEAIEMAWELLTEVYKVDKERLHVTVFGGDQEDGTQEDVEAYDIWKSRINEDRIIKCDKKDNFWEMGDSGPCGPCSEIHVDIRSEEERAKIDGKSLVNQDHPQVIEVWNLVFIQYNRLANGTLQTLPQKHVDTGMGLERLAMVLQHQQSNYNIDLFQSLIAQLESVSGIKYEAGDDKKSVAFRVIADHLRAISFAIADGQLPSNTGAGYVIRRILRRAVRYGYSFLNLNEPFINELIPTLDGLMGSSFSELRKQAPFIKNVIREEEESFLRTLDKGIKRLNALTEGSFTISGKDAFELYDTYGFPLDLTQLIASEKDIKVDLVEFNAELELQKNRSRSSNVMNLDDWQIVKEFSGMPVFIGYDSLEAEIEILRIRKVSQKGNDFYQLVFNQTPFYPEGGGQIGDKGIIVSSDEKIEIIDTKKENDLVVHIVKNPPKNPKSTFKAQVNTRARFLTACNHSATHLLHHGLREVLGTHVEQRGSLVNDKYLRFDFSHFQKMSDDEIKRVEDLVNKEIDSQIDLNEFRDTPINEAKKMGAMSLFGEKYGESVRVIRFGESVELCGGTHVSNSVLIKRFKITSESSIASGIRRIEAITNAGYDRYVSDLEKLLVRLNETLQQPKDLVATVEQLNKRLAIAEGELEALNAEKAMSIKSELLNHVELVHGTSLIFSIVDLSADKVKDISFQLKSQLENAVIALGYVNDEKPGLSLLISEELVNDSINASKLIREAGKFIQGGGGGQPFYATAGGKRKEGLNEAMEFLRKQF